MCKVQKITHPDKKKNNNLSLHKRLKSNLKDYTYAVKIYYGTWMVWWVKAFVWNSDYLKNKLTIKFQGVWHIPLLCSRKAVWETWKTENYFLWRNMAVIDCVSAVPFSLISILVLEAEEKIPGKNKQTKNN